MFYVDAGQTQGTSSQNSVPCFVNLGGWAGPSLQPLGLWETMHILLTASKLNVCQACEEFKSGVLNHLDNPEW